MGRDLCWRLDYWLDSGLRGLNLLILSGLGIRSWNGFFAWLSSRIWRRLSLRVGGLRGGTGRPRATLEVISHGGIWCSGLR
jgi:hypothetical protein